MSTKRHLLNQAGVDQWVKPSGSNWPSALKSLIEYGFAEQSDGYYRLTMPLNAAERHLIIWARPGVWNWKSPFMTLQAFSNAQARGLIKVRRSKTGELQYKVLKQNAKKVESETNQTV